MKLPLLLFSLKQRGYTWINCAEQRLNYVGWCITQGSFCCPARTHSHPTLSCQYVCSSKQPLKQKQGYSAHSPRVAQTFGKWGTKTDFFLSSFPVDHRPKLNTAVNMLKIWDWKRSKLSLPHNESQKIQQQKYLKKRIWLVKVNWIKSGF